MIDSLEIRKNKIEDLMTANEEIKSLTRDLTRALAQLNICYQALKTISNNAYKDDYDASFIANQALEKLDEQNNTL